MKSILALSLIVLAVGCGKEKMNGGSPLGQIRTFNPVVVSSAEKSRISDVCQALRSKGAVLSGQINTPFTFKVATKGCDDNNLPDIGTNVAVTLQRPLDKFIFKRTDGSDFIYADVETDQSGIFSTICQNYDNLTSPIKSQSGMAIWFQTNDIAVNDCTARADERCVLIETGTLEGGSNYRIIARDWIRVRMNPSETRYGFWNFRHTQNAGFCGSDKFTESQANLL